MHTGTSHGVCTNSDSGFLNDIHINYFRQAVNKGGYEILLMGSCRLLEPYYRKILFTPKLSASIYWLALSWIQLVVSTSAGPPWGGLYLKPPSPGGIVDGVTTTPVSGFAGFFPVIFQYQK